jgi:hypothetical protein
MKLPNGRGTFLVRGEVNLTGAIVLGLEVVIILPHTIENDYEQFSGHPIPSTKCLLGGAVLTEQLRTPRGRCDEHSSKFFLSYETKI